MVNLVSDRTILIESRRQSSTFLPLLNDSELFWVLSDGSFPNFWLQFFVLGLVSKLFMVVFRFTLFLVLSFTIKIYFLVTFSSTLTIEYSSHSRFHLFIPIPDSHSGFCFPVDISHLDFSFSKRSSNLQNWADSNCNQ